MRGFFNWLAGIPTDTPVSLEVSQARLFASQYVKRMARQVLVTLTWVRRAATLIMIIAMSVSFDHQAEYLLMLGATVFASWAIPAALDCLTFICVKVLATSAVVSAARWVAGCALVFTVGGSGTLNFLAPGPMVLKWVFVGAMLLIPVAEVVASQIKPDFRKMADMEALLIPMAESTVSAVHSTTDDAVSVAVAVVPDAVPAPLPVASVPVFVEPAAPADELASDVEPIEPELAAPVAVKPRRRRASLKGHAGAGATDAELDSLMEAVPTIANGRVPAFIAADDSDAMVG